MRVTYGACVCVYLYVCATLNTVFTSREIFFFVFLFLLFEEKRKKSVVDAEKRKQVNNRLPVSYAKTINNESTWLFLFIFTLSVSIRQTIREWISFLYQEEWDKVILLYRHTKSLPRGYLFNVCGFIIVYIFD